MCNAQVCFNHLFITTNLNPRTPYIIHANTTKSAIYPNIISQGLPSTRPQLSALPSSPVHTTAVRPSPHGEQTAGDPADTVPDPVGTVAAGLVAGTAAPVVAARTARWLSFVPSSL